jgi:uncharacterized membrane protein
LYYLLLHGWSLVFGRGEAGLRSFSAVIGIATIPIVAGIARRLLRNAEAALCATWLFVLSFLQTWYSQEARGYELTALLTAVMFYSLIRYLESADWRWLAALIVAAVMGLYANNFMFLYAGAIGVAGIVLPSTLSIGRRLKAAAVAGSCVAVAYLPWIGTLAAQVHRVNQDFWIERPTVDSVCEVVARICGVEHFWTWDQYVSWIFHPDVGIGVPRAATFAVAVGAALAIVQLKHDRRRTALALAIVGLLPPLLAAAYSQVRQPIFLPAGFVPSTVVMPVLIAGVIAWCESKLVARGVVAVAIVLSAVNLAAYEHERTKEDWRSAAAAVAAMPGVEHRLIVFVANEAELPFDYYYRPRPGEIETGTPAGFFAVDPPRTQLRVLADDDILPLRRQLAAEHFDDVVLIDSHAGWIDKRGDVHTGYSDPEAFTARYILGAMNVVQRIDLPDDPQKQAITIWRCVPR